MSYSIEYGRKIFYREDYGDKHYYLLIKEGDNNVWDTLLRQRARDWYLITKGYQYQVIEKVCHRAGFCESGSLQRAKGFNSSIWITPEEYIALYRKEIQKACPLEKIFDFFNIESIIRVLKEEYESKYTNLDREKYAKKEILDAIQKYDDWRVINDDVYDKEFKHYRRYIKTTDEFDYFASLPTWGGIGGSNFYYNEFYFCERKKEV